MSTVQNPLPAGDYKTSLPIDRSVPFCPSLYPRDPDEYEPLTHFMQRQKEPERHLLKEVDGQSAVRTAIEDGEIRDNGDGCACFKLPHHGIEYYIVVGFHYDGYRIAVSGWPYIRDESQARKSVYWTSDEVDTIYEFNQDHFGN